LRRKCAFKLRLRVSPTTRTESTMERRMGARAAAAHRASCRELGAHGRRAA
jgi:hypothetical protein